MERLMLQRLCRPSGRCGGRSATGAWHWPWRSLSGWSLPRAFPTTTQTTLSVWWPSVRPPHSPSLSSLRSSSWRRNRREYTATPSKEASRDSWRKHVGKWELLIRVEMERGVCLVQWIDGVLGCLGRRRDEGFGLGRERRTLPWMAVVSSVWANSFTLRISE